jgi:hypothetical protein
VVQYVITKDDIAYDAAAVLQEWFEGHMTLSEDDPRQYKVVQVASEDVRLTVRVESTQTLDVVEDQFEIEIVVRRVDR